MTEQPSEARVAEALAWFQERPRTADLIDVDLTHYEKITSRRHASTIVRAALAGPRPDAERLHGLVRDWRSEAAYRRPHDTERVGLWAAGLDGCADALEAALAARPSVVAPESDKRASGYTLDDAGHRVQDGWDHDGDLIASLQGDLNRQAAELDQLRALLPRVYGQGEEMPEGVAYDGYGSAFELDEPTVNGNRKPYVVLTPALYRALVEAAREAGDRS